MTENRVLIDISIQYYLVNQDGDYLTNEDGDRLVANVIRTLYAFVFPAQKRSFTINAEVNYG